MTDLEIEIERAEQRAVERVLETLVDVLGKMRDDGGARDGTFESLFLKRLRTALKLEHEKVRR